MAGEGAKVAGGCLTLLGLIGFWLSLVCLLVWAVTSIVVAVVR